MPPLINRSDALIWSAECGVKWTALGAGVFTLEFFCGEISEKVSLLLLSEK